MENKSSIHKIALIGVMTAITCILGPLSIPIGIVPISLTTFAVFLTVILLGWKMGTISYLVYLLVGLAGIPVFSGFSSGFGKLAGPTGGYLIGFIFLAIISGIFIDKFRGKVYMYVIGMLLGTVVLYVFGTAWLAIHLHLSFRAALAVGAIPFIPGDIAKIAAVVVVGPIVKRQLIKAKVIIQ